MIQLLPLLPYLLLPVFGAAGYGIRYYQTKDVVVSRQDIARAISWLENLPKKSEVAVRREGCLLLVDLKKLV